jgi:2-polyprenyl-3-methyl-5-hydroxy-6-metoxy-1,4-benzoquinol methylase
MEVQERIRREQIFHDRQARERAASLGARPQGLVVAIDEYLDHEPWIRPALAAFGDLRGKQVLDFGCGHGMAGVVLAGRGAAVTAFDLSGGYLREARARAEANGAAVDFVKANGEQLPFADATFDHVWGNAVLHHLNLEMAGRELRRVLRPRGKAIFCEPWGGNPFLTWARRHLAYPHKERTPEETPLTTADLSVLRQVFPRMNVTGYQLFSMVGRVLGRGILTQALSWCDRQLLARLPLLERWCRYVVIEMTSEE